MQIPKIDQSLISTLDLWKSRSIAFCHRLYKESKKFLLIIREKHSDYFGKGSNIDSLKRPHAISYHYIYSLEYSSFFNLYEKTRAPYNNLRHKLTSFRVLKYSVKLRASSKAGFEAGRTFSLKLAIGAHKRLTQNPGSNLLCFSVSR